MLKLLQSLFGKKTVEVKQPEFHEEIRAQVESQKAEPFPAEVNKPVEAKKPAKKTGAKKAPAKADGKKAPAKKSTKSKK